MSKASINIIYDRDNCTYAGGEEVTGHIFVRSHDNVRCEAITIDRYWETHGRGNTDRGQKQRMVLHKGDLIAGREYRFPFAFTAPSLPVTYRGHYLNIDHYLHARVHVPWAFDVKATEEFIVTPGAGGPIEAGLLPAGTVRRDAPGVSVPMLVGGVILFIVGLFTLAIGIGCVLMPVALVLGAMAFKNVVAQSRIGQVKVEAPFDAVIPGATLPLFVAFATRKPAVINNVTVTLTGKERCVSGSGSNRSTHTHKLHKGKVQLLDKVQTTANELVRIDTEIGVPATTAYSFDASDNKIVWELELRVDIPNWPDWTHKYPLALRPSRSITPTAPVAPVSRVAPVAPAAPVAPVAPIAPTEETAPSPPLLDEPAAAAPQPFEPPPPVIEPPPAPAFEPLSELPSDEIDTPAPAPLPTVSPSADDTQAMARSIEELRTADSLGDQRETMIADLAGRSFALGVRVDRVDWTFSPENDAFRDGRTIVGTLIIDSAPGEEAPAVAVQFPAELNDQVDSLTRDTVLHAACQLGSWNRFYERPELEAMSFNLA